MVANFEGAREFSAQDQVLRNVAYSVQLPKNWDDDARRFYGKVAEFLTNSEFGRYSPTIFAQGSQAIGTAIKPLGRDEFDLDAIVLTEGHQLSAKQLMDSLFAALQSWPDIEGTLERRERCIRVNTEGRYHLDFVPARRSELGGELIEIPDFVDGEWRWKITNPRGFKKWFLSQSEYQTVTAKMRQAEPVPARESVERKSDLKIAVQLIKRHQDQFLDSIGSNLDTPSIVTTTIAGSIGATGSVAGTMDDIINQMTAIAALPVPPDIRNPANQSEVVSEKWSDPKVFEMYRTWSRTLDQDWKLLIAARGSGIDQVSKVLRRMFGGDVTEKAVSNMAKKVNTKSRNNALSASSSGALAFTAPSLGAPKKTFYGIVDETRVNRSYSRRLPINYKARLGSDWTLVGSGRNQILSGSLTPTNFSRTYEIQIIFGTGQPIVKVISPELVVPRDKWVEVHMYDADRPCLFEPSKDDWTAGIQQTPSLLVWLSEWLFFYEIWQTTGVWYGHGEHPV